MDRVSGGITFGLTDRQVMRLTYGGACHGSDGMTKRHIWEFT